MGPLVTQIRVTLLGNEKPGRRGPLGFGAVVLACLGLSTPAWGQADGDPEDGGAEVGPDEGTTEEPREESTEEADAAPTADAAPPAATPPAARPPAGASPDAEASSGDVPVVADDVRETESQVDEVDVEPPDAVATGVGAGRINSTSAPSAIAVKSQTSLPREGKRGEHRGGFAFGSYGRVIAGTDHQGRAPRSADIVAYGSRFDLDNYVELELRREDYWADVDASTKIVTTLAYESPIFHYDGNFDARLAIRNLFIEERDLGVKGLWVWAGSRMYRGDDIYPLNFWPLDNLNTIGGGVGYDSEETWTFVRAHVGVDQPGNPFYRQQAERPVPLNQFGSATVDLLDRQRFVGTLRAEQHLRFGDDNPAGIKFILYGEGHHTPSGQRELEQDNLFEDVPRDGGFVVGGQIGAYSGERDTHLNLFVRYANGLPAYGEFAQPTGLSADRTTSGAHELLIAAGGNLEVGPVTFLLGAYLRSFRNASEGLDFGDLDEGIVLLRPSVYFVEWFGTAVEGSIQLQQRGLLADVGDDAGPFGSTEPSPVSAKVGRIGVMPFLSPAGRGSYKRPIIYAAYMATFRDAGARALYPDDDVFALRDVDHYVGLGAEWWFSSTSYGW